jgi:hypothetical protein
VSEEAEPVALLTIEGIYKDGKVELAERPDNVDEAARVLVTFLPPNGSREKTMALDGQHRETLRQQAFARMKEGVHLGGPTYPGREELYDRFDR